jgi:hypothetical protein
MQPKGRQYLNSSRQPISFRKPAESPTTARFAAMGMGVSNGGGGRAPAGNSSGNNPKVSPATTSNGMLSALSLC